MHILSLLKGLLVKIINLVFGKTAIFMIILGWFLVITGAYMLITPAQARRKMVAHGFGYIKFYLFLLLIFLGMLLISFSTKINGILPKLLTLVAVLVLVRLYFFLRKTIFLRLSAWSERLPPKILKIYAVIQIIIGAIILVFHKRMIY